MNCRAVMVLGFASITLFSGGCGTMENLRDAIPPKSTCGDSSNTIYGGVQKDCSYLVESTPSKDKTWYSLMLTAFDVPFSLVGDTITLPYTLALETGVFGFKTACHFTASSTAPDSELIGPVPPSLQLP
jgi:uncharacterized protein YceK